MANYVTEQGTASERCCVVEIVDGGAQAVRSRHNVSVVDEAPGLVGFDLGATLLRHIASLQPLQTQPSRPFCDQC